MAIPPKIFKILLAASGEFQLADDTPRSGADSGAPDCAPDIVPGLISVVWNARSRPIVSGVA